MAANLNTCRLVRRAPLVVAVLALVALAAPSVAFAENGGGPGGGNGSANAGGNNPNAGGANAGGNGNGNGSANAGGNNPNAGGANAGGNGNSNANGSAGGNGPGNGNSVAGGSTAPGSASGVSPSSGAGAGAPDGSSGSWVPADGTADPGSSAGDASAASPSTAPADEGVAPSAPAPAPVSTTPQQSHPSAPAHTPPSAAPAPPAPRKPESAPVPTAPPIPAVTKTAPTVADYGVKGEGAKLTLRYNGVGGGAAIRVGAAHNGSFVFRAAGNVRVLRVGLLYRIGAWLRSDMPGVTVCLRIQEVSAKDPLTSVRTTETCVSPSTHWQHFRILRRTLARGDKLRFSIYSYSAELGDNFEISHFVVLRKTAHGWKRVARAFASRQAAGAA
jgi:hypothetical protein